MRRRPAATFLAVVVFLAGAAPAFAHDLPMGGSRWCFGRNRIVANIDLGAVLLKSIKGMEEWRNPVDGVLDEQMHKVVTEILQPYLDEKLSVTEDGKSYPVKVDRLVSNGDTYTIWLSVEHIPLDPGRPVTIDYKLLFDETQHAHVNLAYGYVSEATGDALKSVFDFSPPAMQHTFESSAHEWTMIPPGTAKTQASVASTSMPVASRKLEPAQPAQPAAGARVELPGAQAPASPHSRWREILANVGRFVLLGIEHILTGYDHIAFLVALVVVAPSLRAVLPIITAFTAAHSITLLLAALRLVSLDSRLIESAIAVSICYVAVENLFRRKATRRWLVAFCFGLVHGFGFASVLQNLIVGRANLVSSVVSFNVGVELGQLMIFAALLPLLRLLGALIEPRKMTIAASAAIGLLGFVWVLERSFDLRLLRL
jgi:hydrogenase/urease accessory protein HupE